MEFVSKLTEKQKKILGALSIVGFAIFMIAVFLGIGIPMINFVSEPQLFRNWVDSKGIWGRVVFIGMVAFQVLFAIIPGEPLEIGAGYAFGAIEGTLLCMIGITLGSMAVFSLVRTLGIRVVEIFFPIEKIRSLRFLSDAKKLNTLTFIIFLIPGTPKDLISYFVGLTDMKISSWILITSLARLPSIVTSTAGGNALGGERYIAAILIFAITAAVSGVGIFIYKRISDKRKGQDQ